MLEFIETNWVELVGAIAGLIYLYLEYKADIRMWPTGILMSSFYAYVFIQARFYAFAYINIYYILAAVYGWLKWNRHKAEENTDVGITHTPKPYYPKLAGATVLLFALISFVLVRYTDSPVPYGDSFVTTLSIISMWMLAHKLLEQWLLLTVLNAASVYLYFTQGLAPTSGLYMVYTVGSVLGYFKWKKIMK
ncbi:MAG: nicotinamide riboside transporter PnuC [Prevotella sp.]|jgi:nicotinamide mononucleotide transporter|nr:nicotinamide riboside transporter PnuC [Prevotella sp.]